MLEKKSCSSIYVCVLVVCTFGGQAHGLFWEDPLTVERRQVAIPGAMAASMALTGHTNTITNASRQTDTTQNCNKTLPYCDPFINQQYKLDEEMKKIPTTFNITDSTYNASIVHALATNKTTVTRNKTIVFLQNQQQKGSRPPAEPFATLKELTNMTFPLNKSITNKTIYIPPHGTGSQNSSPVKPERLTEVRNVTDGGYNSTSNAPLNNSTYIPGDNNQVPGVQQMLGHSVPETVPVIQIKMRTDTPNSPPMMVPIASLTNGSDLRGNESNVLLLESAKLIPQNISSAGAVLPVSTDLTKSATSYIAPVTSWSTHEGSSLAQLGNSSAGVSNSSIPLVSNSVYPAGSTSVAPVPSFVATGLSSSAPGLSSLHPGTSALAPKGSVFDLGSSSLPTPAQINSPASDASASESRTSTPVSSASTAYKSISSSPVQNLSAALQSNDAQLNDTLRTYGLYIPPQALQPQQPQTSAVAQPAPRPQPYAVTSGSARRRYTIHSSGDADIRSVSPTWNVVWLRSRINEKNDRVRKKMSKRRRILEVSAVEGNNNLESRIFSNIDTDPTDHGNRDRRYLFEYDSNRDSSINNNGDDISQLPALFPADSFDPMLAPLAGVADTSPTTVVKTSRSDISRLAPRVDGESDLEGVANVPNSQLVDERASSRGRIEIPDDFNYERSLQPIGVPARRMIDQLLAGGRAPERIMDNFFPAERNIVSKSSPRWETASRRDDLGQYERVSTRPESDLIPRSEQDKLKEEEMEKMLKNLDSQTQKIASLYKYFDPGSRDHEDSSSFNEREESNELSDPRDDERRGWRDSGDYHGTEPVPGDAAEGSRDYTAPEGGRNAEDHGWGDPSVSAGAAAFRPDHQTTSFWDESRHDFAREKSDYHSPQDRDFPTTDERDHAALLHPPESTGYDSRRTMVNNPNIIGGDGGVRYNREEIMKELLGYIKIKQEEAAALHSSSSSSPAAVSEHRAGETRGFINNPSSDETGGRVGDSDSSRNTAYTNLLKMMAAISKSRTSIPQFPSVSKTPISTNVRLQDPSLDFPLSSPVVQTAEKKDISFTPINSANPVAPTLPPSTSTGEERSSTPEGGVIEDLSSAIGVPNIMKEKGVVMLVIATPKDLDDDNPSTPPVKEVVQHKELTSDGVTRSHPATAEATDDKDKDKDKDKEEKEEKDGDDSDDFSKNLKEATNLVLGDEIKAGNITKEQRDDIEEKLSKILNIQKKNKTISDVVIAAERNSSHNVVGDKKSTTPKAEKRLFSKLTQVPADPVMYLDFESAKDDHIPDGSGNRNHAKFEDKAGLSKRVLGTCGKAAEMNEGSITWRGSKFHRKPDKAVTIALWVKIKKSGVINWFANGREGDRMFYTESKGAAVPAKVWTHITGSFDSKTGLARIYINGNIEQETQKKRDTSLSQNWLVNGIGEKFGDDSMQYVDDLLVYDRALNTSEVKMLANRCIFNRMILHYGFQDGNKTFVHDQSGLENNGILTGGALAKKECNRCGYCMDLQAGPDPSLKIQQISLKNLPRVKVSIAVWISLNDTKGVHNIFRTESSKGNIGYQIQVKNGRVRWYIASDKGHTIFDNTTKNVVVPESLWTHIVVSYNNENGVVNIYVNSILKLKEHIPEPKRKFLPVNWDNDASIGDSSSHGYLDEFILYNWELDSSEVLYVRNYCADHPKLVRFTVRVPLTKKTAVPARPKSDIGKDPSKGKPSWWALYKKLLEKKNEVTRRTITSLHNFQRTLSTAYPLLKHK